MQFLDLGRRLRRLEPELRSGMERVISRGRALDGPELADFEREWALACGARLAVGVASGTDALRLTLMALGVGRGDEVIVPAFTAIPTLAAVCAAGATPVPADVDPGTAALDASAAARAQTSRTRAVIVVHLYGRPAPIPDLGVPVIEDAAHSHGALREVGGAAAAYSIYPTKNLGAFGDGGAVVTDDPELAAGVVALRAHGRDAEGVHRVLSTNSRMSEMTAAGLRAALPLLARDNARRREIAAVYRRAAPELGWQDDHPDHVHHLCVARVDDRDSFRAGAPFGTSIHYPRAVVDEPAYTQFERDQVPTARDWATRCVSLPCYPELESAEIGSVSDALAEITASRSL